MKVKWEAKDIEGGRVVQKPDCGITGTYMIGFRYDGAAPLRGQRYGLVSLADGMWETDFSSFEELAAYMNEFGYFLPIEILNPSASRILSRPVTGGSYVIGPNRCFSPKGGEG